jgi:hypothetical protein
VNEQHLSLAVALAVEQDARATPGSRPGHGA